MAGNTDTTWDAVLSTTLKHITPRIEDNVFGNSTLLWYLREGDRIERVSGGQSLVEPLLYGVNDTTSSYSGYDNLATTPQEGITTATYDWKQYAVTVAINGLERAQNSQPEQITSLLQAKIDQAELSAVEAMNAMFWGNGTGNSQKDWLGIDAIISVGGDSGLHVEFVGDIDSEAAGNTWWRNQSENTAEALTPAVMSSMWNLCSKGKIHPEFLISDAAGWEAYEAQLQPALRYQSTKAADAGFENLLFKSAPFMWDENCPAGTGDVGSRVYFLNSRFLKLKVHKQVWFKNTPFERPHGQDATYSQILSYGNLVTNNRRFLGVLDRKS